MRWIQPERSRTPCYLAVTVRISIAPVAGSSAIVTDSFPLWPILTVETTVTGPYRRAPFALGVTLRILKPFGPDSVTNVIGELVIGVAEVAV